MTERISTVRPIHSSRATLVDLLDRVLDKGLVINADIIISVAGVPLIGINLRAALAGMETMTRYGMMREWDEQSRAWERDRRRRMEAAPDPDPEELGDALQAQMAVLDNNPEAIDTSRKVLQRV